MAERAAVFGATGGIGTAVTSALLRKGIAVRAVGRSQDRLRAAFPSGGVEAVSADPFDAAAVAKAARGCTLVFHCVNLLYAEWDRQPALVETLLNGARSAGARFAFPANVYVYGRPQTTPISEDHPQEAHTVKGRIRCAIEQTMLEAHRQGEVPVVIGRFPDYYGPHVRNTLTDSMFFGARHGRPMVWLGDPNLPHEFIYNDDAAEALVRLALDSDAYGQVWHVPGPGVISAREWAQTLGREIGRPVKLKVYPPWMLGLVGLFDRGTREVKEMQYLWQTPVILDGAKYRARFGPWPATPFAEGIRRTLDWAQAPLPTDL
ncbi:MAG: NAD-dependent epimerase/dehydratase family protein [Chloroflexi bacterium]|nr:NAD-dependent epimerase/dehydratase family protein [Chloroflexota bacterium]